jgi:hypothetical protein
MAIQLNELDGGRLLHVTASGKLSHQDYERFTPEFERLARGHGNIRILFEMRDFHGWEGPALWDEIKMDVKHSSDVHKVAMVGDKKWEQVLTMLGKPFSRASIGYFDLSEIASAKQWLMEGSVHPVTAAG